MRTSENYSTAAEVESIRSHARRLSMDAEPLFWCCDIGELCRIYNGCGPDSWTDAARCMATWVYRNFREAIAIHDFDFEFSDGKPETLLKVNRRFLCNAQTKVDVLYPAGIPILWPVRAWAWSKVRAAYLALLCGSDEAWRLAHLRHTARDADHLATLARGMSDKIHSHDAKPA